MVKIKSAQKFWQIIVGSNSIIEGHFFFKSYYHTRYIIDTSIIFQYPHNVETVSRAIYKSFSRRKIDCIVTPNHRSGVLLAHNIGDKFNANIEVLKRERGIINIPPGLNIRGNVLIIDDGINTGDSLAQVLSLSKFPNTKIVGVGIFIDRYIGDFEKDFKFPYKSIISVKNDPYNIINTKEERCPLCDEYRKTKIAINRTTDIDKIDELQQRLKGLDLQCAYVDVEV